MKDFLAKNIEKVLLTVLLAILAICAVYKISTIERVVVKTPTSAGDDSADINEVAEMSMKVVDLKDEDKPYNGSAYIFCRKMACRHIIKKGSAKCPVCLTPTKVVIVSKEEKDRDEDGIPNDVEIKVGLNPDDPNDALWDKDKDGFSNLDEYKFGTSIDDKAVHPPVINRAYLKSAVYEYYPVAFTEIVVNKEDDPKSKWDIYLTEYVGRKKSQRIKRINESLDKIQYKIIDVDKDENGEYFVVLKKGEEPSVTLTVSTKRKVKNVKYPVVNKLNKNVYVYLGESFTLKDKDGTGETYKAVSYDKKKKLLKVIDEKQKEEVLLGFKVIIEDPEEDGATKEDPKDRELGPELDIERELRRGPGKRR